MKTLRTQLPGFLLRTQIKPLYISNYLWLIDKSYPRQTTTYSRQTTTYPRQTTTYPRQTMDI